MPFKTHPCTCVYTAISTLFIYIYIQRATLHCLWVSIYPLPQYMRHTVWVYTKVYVHMPQHVYIHFCLCVHKSFKGTIYRDASFLESCSKVKTECHNCEKSQKEIEQKSLHKNSSKQFHHKKNELVTEFTRLTYDFVCFP